MREIVEVVAIIVLFFIIVHFVVQNYQVKDTSMQPTLNANADVMVNKTAYLFHGPERGDVIVFHVPRDTQRDYIGRIIGLPGDTIQTDSSQIWVNGVLLSEPYVHMPTNPVARIWKMPPNSYFVVSDNRVYNDDSRTWDALPRDFIVGKAVVVYWPLNNLQFINTYSGTYSQLVNTP
jgi:signal peptidase I